MNNLELRVARLESLLNEDVDFSEKEKIFTYLCKSCNLTDVEFIGKLAVCTFNMSTFYRRIQSRMHLKYKYALKSTLNERCRIICNMETQEWILEIGYEREPLTREEIPHGNDTIALTKNNRRIILVCIGEALERILDRIGGDLLI